MSSLHCNKSSRNLGLKGQGGPNRTKTMPTDKLIAATNDLSIESNFRYVKRDWAS